MSATESRKLFTGGEWITLLGMVLVVFSPVFLWKHEPPVINRGFEAIGRVYVSPRAGLMTGYDLKLGWLPVGWTAVLCAVACGTLLLFDVNDARRRLFFGLQVACSIAVIALAALNIGLFTGSLMALAGGLLLLWGAFLRYR